MRKVIPVEELSSDTRALFEVLNKESDMACVVIGAAFLDSTLASLLEIILRKSEVTDKLLAPSGSLGSFTTRADLAYCLKLIEKPQYQDITLIAEVRNQFAHSHLQLSFADPTVQSLCNRFNEWRKLIHGEKEDIPANPTEEEQRTIARNQFKLTVIFLANGFLLKALSLKQKRNA